MTDSCQARFTVSSGNVNFAKMESPVGRTTGPESGRSKSDNAVAVAGRTFKRRGDIKDSDRDFARAIAFWALNGR